jgi:hypothetical protein
MSIKAPVSCPCCHFRGRVSPEKIGRKIHCPKCRAVFIAGDVPDVLPAPRGGALWPIVALGFVIAAGIVISAFLALLCSGPSVAVTADAPAAPQFIDVPGSSDHGDIRLFVLPYRDRPPLASFGQTRFGDESFGVGIGLENISPATKVDYRSWSRHDAGIRLTDDLGNTYRLRSFPITSAVIGATGDTTLYQGKVKMDALWFEPPVAAAKWLYLELPLRNIGQPGAVTLRAEVATLMTMEESRERLKRQYAEMNKGK